MNQPSTDLDVASRDFELDQRRAKAYSESGYWPDAASVAKALVKIEAGRSLGLPAIVAMSEVHVIEGKPTLGAGALASLVKGSGKYDYRVLELTDAKCVIRFFDTYGEVLGDSTFTLEDAKTAGLMNRGPWKQYPRNMLFARAMSNGVAWFCPDVVTGRIYTPDELDPDAGAPSPDLDLEVHDLELEQAANADFEPSPPAAIDEEEEPSPFKAPVGPRGGRGAYSD